MTLIYGHRGAKGEAPENTLPSFQRCLEHGVTRCELDLHLSRDGELMVIHDPTLKRTTGRRGKVSEQLAEDLVTYDARQGGPGWVRPCPIPRLAELFERGATVTAYDPVAMAEARRIFGDDARLSYADSPNGALKDADALIIVTEWKEFRSPDFDRIKASLKTPVIFDGRNLYEPELVRQAGLAYESIGRPVA